jgi:hypothetical protein
MSDDGDAGMAHFGRINKASRTSMILKRSCPPCCHQQGRVYTCPNKPDTLATLPGALVQHRSPGDGSLDVGVAARFHPCGIRWFEETPVPMSRFPLDWIGRTQIESGLSEHRDLLRTFHPGHDRRQVVTDVAVAFAHGASNVATAAGVLDQARVVCGPAASTATLWRVFHDRSIEPAVPAPQNPENITPSVKLGEFHTASAPELFS